MKSYYNHSFIIDGRIIQLSDDEGNAAVFMAEPDAQISLLYIYKHHSFVNGEKPKDSIVLL